MKRTLMVSAFFVVLYSVTMVGLIEYMKYSYLTANTGLVVLFLPAWFVIFAIPIYLSEIDLHYSICFFVNKKFKDEKGRFILNIGACFVDIIMLHNALALVLMDYLDCKYLMSVSQLQDGLVYSLMIYVVYRIVYLFIVLSHFFVRKMQN